MVLVLVEGFDNLQIVNLWITHGLTAGDYPKCLNYDYGLDGLLCGGIIRKF